MSVLEGYKDRIAEYSNSNPCTAADEAGMVRSCKQKRFVGCTSNALVFTRFFHAAALALPRTSVGHRAASAAWLKQTGGEGG